MHDPSFRTKDLVAPNRHEQADRLIRATGAAIRHGGAVASYNRRSDVITVPEAARFSTVADRYATVLHELAHWTGHDTRLARDLRGRFGTESYSAEELVAELAAAFLCADLGVQGRLQHAEYIGSWIRVLKGDKRAIFTASRLAQQSADYLLRQVGGGEEEDVQEAA